MPHCRIVADGSPQVCVKDDTLWAHDLRTRDMIAALPESEVDAIYAGVVFDFWQVSAPAVAEEHGYSSEVYSDGRSGGWLQPKGHPDQLAFVEYIVTDDPDHREPFYIPAYVPPEPPANWDPDYSSWRHGGWYVGGVRHESGACGCVSRNYADRKWRIVCDPREGSFPGGPNDHTYANRDEAARAEWTLANIDEDTRDEYATAIAERDRFLKFAEAIDAAVKDAGESFVARLRDEMADLERRREANAVRSEN